MKTKTIPSAFIPLSRAKFVALLGVAVAAASVSSLRARADIEWQGPTASYNTPTNWVGGVVPGATNNGDNSNGLGNVIQLNPGDPDWTLTDLTQGGVAGASGATDQNGPTLNINGWFHIGAGTNSTGLYTLDAGTLNIPNGALFLNEGPGSTATLNINNGTINKGNANGNPFYISVGNWNGSGARTGTVNQVNGTLNVSSETWIGQAALGTGFYNLHGGTINSSNWFVIGRGGSTGVMTMDGGVINHYSGGQPAFIDCDTGGSGSSGTLNFSAGTINTIGSEFWIANGSGSTASNNMSGTAVLNAGNWLAVGRGGAGVLNISGNAIVNKTGGGNITLAGTSSSTTGTINQSGGIITNTTSQIYVGESGTGNWNMTGGTNYVGKVIVCLNGSATGTLNLSGGFMQLSAINSGTSAAFSSLNLNGTAVQANSSTTNFISGMTQAFVSSGGALIDSQGFNIAVPQTLQDGGGGFLVKNGSGTLTLTGANSYSGSNIVNAGTLIMGTGASTSGNIAVANGSGFGVIVQAAGGQYSAGSATLGTSGATTLSFDLGGFGNPASAPLNITSGPLALNGTVTVSIADALPQVGQFPLIQYAAGQLTGSGTMVLGSLPVGVTASIVMNTANNSIDLNITGVNQPRWDGTVNGSWDINTTMNWINIGTGLGTYYTDGSPVVFNDSATGTTAINLTTTVSPNKITIANSALPYSFGGTGKIAGSSGITKTGTNSLTITNTGGNTYTGPTVLSGGVTTVNSLANGGAASSIGASSASPTNLVISSATFAYTGPTVAVNRGFQISSGIFDAEGNVSFSGIGTTTSGTLYKVGPATMTYAGVGTNVLSPANVGGAYQVQNGTTVLDGSAGAQTNNVIGELWVSSTTNFAANLNLTNTSLGISSWYALGRGNGNGNFASTATIYNSLMSVAYANTGAGGATQGGGVSLGYANGLPNSGSQTMSVSGTSILTNYGGNFNISESAGSRSVFNLANSASLTAIYSRFAIGGTAGNGVVNLNSTGTATASTTFGQIFLGGLNGGTDPGAGALNMSSGILKFGNGSGVYIHLGADNGAAATAYGSLVLSGGAINETSGDGLRVGYGGMGSFVQSGGTLSMGRYMSIGGNVASGNGVATFTGGTAGIFNNAYRVLLPDVGNATGVFNMGTEAGGNAIFTNLYNSGGASFIMENSAGGNGTLNLNSGTLQLAAAIHRANSSGGSAVVNLNGGTLQANNTGISLIDTSLSSVNMFKGGVVVDPVANVTTISGNLLTTFGNGIYPSGGKLAVTANGGTGYIGAPLVTVTGGSGSGAMAIATVSNGIVTNVVLTCPGQNYVSGDVVTFGFAGGGYLTAASNLVYTLQPADVAANAGGGLTKIGTGSLYLTGGGTYTGTTAVNNGLLSGSGTFFSPVTVAANSTLGVGSSSSTIGTFTVNGAVTFAANSTNLMKVNKSTSVNDLLNGVSTLTYGGTLVVSNLAGTYAGGESYKLFNAATYSGSFAAIVPATPGSGLTWNTNNLTVNGTLSISGGVNTNRTNITYTVTGSSLNLSWPSDHLGWRLQGQTNAAGAGISTNWVTVPGSSSVTNVTIPVSTANSSVFFRLVYP